MADNCDFSMSGLRKRLPEAFSTVTSSTVSEIIAKVVKQEDKYWREDGKLDQEYTKNSDEEYVGSKLLEDDELMHYLWEGWNPVK